MTIELLRISLKLLREEQKKLLKASIRYADFLDKQKYFKLQVMNGTEVMVTILIKTGRTIKTDFGTMITELKQPKQFREGRYKDPGWLFSCLN